MAFLRWLVFAALSTATKALLGVEVQEIFSSGEVPPIEDRTRFVVGGSQLSGVYADWSGEMEIVQDQLVKVMLEIDQAWEPFVQIVSFDGGRTLTVQQEQSVRLICTAGHNCVKKITVFLPQIDRISLVSAASCTMLGRFSATGFLATNHGSGTLSATVHAAGHVSASNWNTGDIELSGRADRLSVVNGGTGMVRAVAMPADEVDVDVKTDAKGRVEVWANRILKVAIDGGGDVLYKGDPHITEASMTGLGRLRKYEVNDDVDCSPVSALPTYVYFVMATLALLVLLFALIILLLLCFVNRRELID